MDTQEILSHVDHTLLKPTATWTQTKVLCEQAINNGTASVCIPPSYVAQARQAFPQLRICTVVGFPLGFHRPAVKAAEASLAIKEGADEIDMVINQGALKEGNLDLVSQDIAAVREATTGKVLKVIVETCYLDNEEKALITKIVGESGADYIKTSTGFGIGGATVEDIEIFLKNRPEGLKIKAAGGVKTRKDLEVFIEMGCDRIGTSSAVDLLAGKSSAGSY